jgi:hypothetical protein
MRGPNKVETTTTENSFLIFCISTQLLGLRWYLLYNEQSRRGWLLCYLCFPAGGYRTTGSAKAPRLAKIEWQTEPWAAGQSLLYLYGAISYAEASENESTSCGWRWHWQYEPLTGESDEAPTLIARACTKAQQDELKSRGVVSDVAIAAGVLTSFGASELQLGCQLPCRRHLFLDPYLLLLWLQVNLALRIVYVSWWCAWSKRRRRFEPATLFATIFYSS